MTDKDVRYSQKKVDESWKAEVSGGSKPSEPSAPSASQESLDFSTYLASIGVQCMSQLGQVGDDTEKKPAVNLAAAKQGIDLLLLIREKTKGNLSQAEGQLLTHLISDLQMKFVQESAKKTQ